MLNIGMQESATVAEAEKNALAMTMYENRTVPLACWRPRTTCARR
jgi:hypothetical protein